MKNGYKRRADWGDMPLESKLGILVTELEEYAETEEEKTNAQVAIERMKEVIEKLTPKEFVPKDPAQPWLSWPEPSSWPW
jgi:hypothetical protein